MNEPGLLQIVEHFCIRKLLHEMPQHLIGLAADDFKLVYPGQGLTVLPQPAFGETPVGLQPVDKGRVKRSIGHDLPRLSFYHGNGKTERRDGVHTYAA